MDSIPWIHPSDLFPIFLASSRIFDSNRRTRVTRVCISQFRVNEHALEARGKKKSGEKSDEPIDRSKDQTFQLRQNP